MYDLAVEKNKFICAPPRQLKKKDIDWKMRPICDRINASDYCWTVFCCQGHTKGLQKGSLPYLVLLCVNEKRPEILNKLYSAFEVDEKYDNNLPLMGPKRSEEHKSELQSHHDLVCRLRLAKRKPRHPDRNSTRLTTSPVSKTSIPSSA